GCVIARDNAFLAVAHNTVAAATDITAHAEVNAVRQANQSVGELHLPGAVVATTCEPCPMCMAALHWAGVETVYFGASIADAEAAGFRELRLSAEALVSLGESGIELVSGVLTEQCRELFADWLNNDERQPY
ncbi:MAG: nucleoside deaminase, partial [bacterium]|nr:nucleoside deaminase [bacterium]